jgi:glycosyltransferase involved in cell wall biosynthesis
VLFVGPQPDDVLVSLLRRSQFVVFPSLFEGLSQALLEALQYGCAVLAADASSNAETVGQAGWLFDGLDVDAMARVLAEALDAPERLAELRRNAVHEFERYDWAIARRKLTAIYKHVAKHPLTGAEQALLAEATGVGANERPRQIASSSILAASSRTRTRTTTRTINPGV